MKDNYSTKNRKRMQILVIDLEKNLGQQSAINYSNIEKLLTKLLNIIQHRNMADLHLIRKLKVIPCITEICKQISLCPKSKILELRRCIERSTQIFRVFITVRENRDYMLNTNRTIVLIELLLWFLKFKSTAQP